MFLCARDLRAIYESPQRRKWLVHTGPACDELVDANLSAITGRPRPVARLFRVIQSGFVMLSNEHNQVLAVPARVRMIASADFR